MSARSSTQTASASAERRAVPRIRAEVLEARAELLHELREFFRQRGFLEVETPVLCSEVIVDRHLEPFCVHQGGDQNAGLWLQTSPEYSMKRLLAAHRRSMFQITRAFRQHEQGPLHNPEFTLLEWYEVGADYHAGLCTTAELAATILGRGEAERVSYRDAFLRYAGIDPLVASEAQLRDAAQRSGTPPPEGIADRDGWLEFLLVTCVEPHLGRSCPTLLYDFPENQAALACIRPGDPPVAERFELYVDGIELANGYHELRDADELMRRMKENNRMRLAQGRRALPEPNLLARAMQADWPACTGVALGVDRLLMVRLGIRHIDEVLVFPMSDA